MTDAVIYPGSFDPITIGHEDIIRRASRSFGEVIVAVLENPAKRSSATFDTATRMELITESTKELGNVRVASFSGLLVTFCQAQGVHRIVKGLRAVSDFESELQMAQMNDELGDIETLFLAASPEHSFVSSSLIKQVAKYDGDVSRFVAPHVATALASVEA